MPRLFKYLSSKACGTLSAFSKSSIKQSDSSTSTAIKKRTEVSVSFQPPPKSYKGGSNFPDIWADRYSHQYHQKHENISLCNVDGATRNNVMRNSEITC